MPITQTRMIAVLTGWRSTYETLRWLKDHIADGYNKAVSSGDWETFANELLIESRKANLLPEHLELLLGEEAHFKANKHKNNYMQRRQAALRHGTDPFSETRKAEGTQFGEKRPVPKNFQKKYPERTYEPPRVKFDIPPGNFTPELKIKPLAPPPPDKLAEAFQGQIDPFASDDDGNPTWENSTDEVRQKYFDPETKKFIG